jgi:hypothetical protein
MSSRPLAHEQNYGSSFLGFCIALALSVAETVLEGMRVSWRLEGVGVGYQICDV